MMLTASVDNSQAASTPRHFLVQPAGLHLAFRWLLYTLLALTTFCALSSALYLGKCELGIDLFEGPSILHAPLYWILDCR